MCRLHNLTRLKQEDAVRSTTVFPSKEAVGVLCARRRLASERESSAMTSAVGRRRAPLREIWPACTVKSFGSREFSARSTVTRSSSSLPSSVSHLWTSVRFRSLFGPWNVLPQLMLFGNVRCFTCNPKSVIRDAGNCVTGGI